MNSNELKELLSYDPDTGLFTWKISTSKRVKVGDVAGSEYSNGYIYLTIKGKKYVAHRLAFLYMEGYIPKEVDHINRIKSDNRWINLRSVSRSENSINKGLQSNNTSGTKGVYFNKSRKRWIAEIKVEGEKVTLGSFTNKEEAVSCRKAAEERLHAF